MSEGVERNEDNVNGFAIAVVGISVAIVLYASIVALQAYYKQSENPEEQRRQSANQSDAMRNLRASQQAELDESSYVGGGTEFASIPLSDAMKKVVVDERAHKPTLVPVVPAHDKATVPAIPGKPIEGGAAAGAVGENSGDSAGGEEQAEEGSGSADGKSSAEEGKGGEDKAAKGKEGSAKGKTEGKAKSKTKSKAAKGKEGSAKGKTEGKAKSKTKGKAAKDKEGSAKTKAKPEAKKAKEEAKPSN